MNPQRNIEKKKVMKTGRGRKVLKGMLFLCCIGLLCYAALVCYVYYIETHVPIPSDYDSIIVLGAEVKPTGEPSVQLQWRLDKAEEMYRNRPCPVVVCGGKGANEPAPEGEIMKEVLVLAGLPEMDVYAESSSINTKENIANAKRILDTINCKRPLIVTTDYHLPRALSIARDVGLQPQGIGSPARSELNFWLKNHMREALSWVKYWGIKYLRLPL